ncbi:hypothetical protein [Falsiroseomonas oryzae]|uniref:hypothetical protein n=1 Tax=Falsiroseomonas oryzae TaxID=2766473 RepID=UPI0022EA7F8E|nr:hypothetical protein [Roseomonas sp. MO-31]
MACSSDVESAGLPAILADLSAGLGGEEACLCALEPDGAVVALASAGRPARAPWPLPAVQGGDIAQMPFEDWHLGCAAGDGEAGSRKLVLVVRRRTAFATQELRLIRAALRAMIVSKNR